MSYFEFLLVCASFLCTLVAGFLFAFAIVVMPGIKSLGDPEFIRAFQVMDGIIQRNQPLFLFVWLGSALSVVAAAGFGIAELAGWPRVTLVVAASAYILTVQLPTIAINIPLNNQLQRFDTRTGDEAEHLKERQRFEARWTKWNSIRTITACVVSLTLLILLLNY